MIVDPVCGEDLEGVEYPDQEEFEGRLYFFGSIDCAQVFRQDPAKYAQGHEEWGTPVPDYPNRKTDAS